MTAKIIRPLDFRPFVVWLVVTDDHRAPYRVDYVTKRELQRPLDSARMVRRPFESYAAASAFIRAACPWYLGHTVPVVSERQEVAA